MTKEKIGEAAGLVWEKLITKDEIGLTELPRALKLKSDIAYQALGWLAREDKIHYRTKAGKVYVSLVEKEREVAKAAH
ncbi:MAG TPA: hypothetical protein DEO84_12490 [candidate division Zixibacteria bacterium]|nr:hypothetical protein [candidate division Zixibacteria bacterium]HBZ02127.1 hypothetical protein [candidate division Zixibacteria bacterium]